MVQQGQVRKKYPSDLTDEQWAIVEPMIPPPSRAHEEGARGRSTCGKSCLHCCT
jgi:transposase